MPTNTSNATMAGPLTLLQAADVATWYERYTPQLRSFIAHYLLRCPEDAADVDDVLQETFLRLMRHLAAFTDCDDAHRLNYVYQAARHIVTDAYRKGRQPTRAAVPLSAVPYAPMQPVTASHDWQAGMQPEQTTAARLTLRALWEATQETHRRLLVLLLAGRDREEIAAILGVSLRAVDVRCCRLRHALREIGEQIA